MALSIITQPLRYEENDVDDLLALDYLGDEYEKSLRPSIADRLNIGFLASDCSTQTDVTEIPDIKQMTSTVSSLVAEMASLKRDFDFTKQVLKASFDQKLQDKSFELYSKLNDRLMELKSVHEERVQVVRRSFKQQLQDALVKMASHYKKYYEDKLAGKLSSSSNKKSKAKIASLEMELRTSQSLVQMLQTQLDEARLELQAKPIKETIIDTSELDAALDQNKELQVEIMRLGDKNEELNLKIQTQNEKIAELQGDLKEIRTEMENERKAKRRMSTQIDDAKKKMDAERLEAMRLLEEQKQAMEKDMADKLAEKEARAADSARENQRQLADMEEVLSRRMAEERRKYEVKISQLIEENQRKSLLMESTTEMERVIEQQKQDILVLRQRLVKMQKQWEKKFSILRASMHALKDEAYIRMQLQKQSASLKYASVSYGTNPQNIAVSEQPSQQPFHQIEPGKAQQVKPLHPGNKPLPAITRLGRLLPGRNTISLPSGVGTDPFPEEEQEDEDIEPDDSFIALPPKTASLGQYMSVATKSE